MHKFMRVDQVLIHTNYTILNSHFKLVYTMYYFFKLPFIVFIGN